MIYLFQFYKIARLSNDTMSVKEPHYTRSLISLLLIVCHHHDSTSVFLVQTVKQLHDFSTHLRVKITGRLVGKNNRRIAYDSTRYSHALALTVAKACDRCGVKALRVRAPPWQAGCAHSRSCYGKEAGV